MGKIPISRKMSMTWVNIVGDRLKFPNVCYKYVMTGVMTDAILP